MNITYFFFKMPLKDFIYHVHFATNLFAALLVTGKYSLIVKTVSLHWKLFDVNMMVTYVIKHYIISDSLFFLLVSSNMAFIISMPLQGQLENQLRVEKFNKKSRLLEKQTFPSCLCKHEMIFELSKLY